MSQPEKAQLDQIRVVTPPGKEADPLATKEAVSYEEARQRELLADLTQDRVERKTYANRIFYLVTAWLAVILVILLLQGFKSYGFNLDNSVLITLIGTTTGSIVAIFILVTKYLFPYRQKQPDE